MTSIHGHRHPGMAVHRMDRRQASTASTSSSGSSTCTSLYSHPAAGETVTAYTPYNIAWDCNCLGSSVAEIDITLYLVNGGALHGWTHVPCPDNSFQATFNPSWWNSTQSANLQLQITESDQPVWATTTGIGPAFDMVWNGTVPASSMPGRNGNSTGVSIESVAAPDTAGGVTGGKLAAAVTVPLIAAAIGVAAYIFYSRRKGKTQRKRWSAYVDNRMSMISTGQGDQSFGGTGSPSREGRPSMTMSMHAHSARPSISNRPISAYSVGAQSNFAGVGSRHIPAASLSASTPAPQSHSRNQSQMMNGRPTSSFYALDGHSIAESAATTGAVEGAYQPTHRTRPSGTGFGDRVSKISFAESAHTNNKDFANKRASYYANGPGTASSPNSHRYKHSAGLSTSSIPAMPRVPVPAAFSGNTSADLASGVDTEAPHSLSTDDVASLAQSSPANSPTKQKRKKPQHQITISTSMPFLGNPGGRQSIMSPDDLMKAYAIKGSQPTPSTSQASQRPDTVFTQASKFDEEEEEAMRSSEEGEGKKGKFGGRFGFGFNNK